jgi:hypothetical protein
MPEPRPLWRIMHTAHMQHADPLAASARKGYAAELRAIADAVERRGALGLDLDPGETADWLRAEAERAEKVE